MAEAANKPKKVKEEELKQGLMLARAEKNRCHSNNTIMAATVNRILTRDCPVKPNHLGQTTITLI